MITFAGTEFGLSCMLQKGYSQITDETDAIFGDGLVAIVSCHKLEELEHVSKLR